MKQLFATIFALASLSTTACGVFFGGAYGFIYNDVTTSRSWSSLQKNDNTPAAEAHGEACASSILSLVATGNAGFDAAYKAALASSGANSLWDVRVDTKVTNILGVYGTVCTEITGKISK